MEYTFRPAVATNLGLILRGEMAYIRAIEEDNPAVRLYERCGFARGDDRDGYRTYAMRLN
jgi:hypothetical protein